MYNYLTVLIEEKGKALDSGLNIDGHIGLTYQMLVDFICEMKDHHQAIKTMLVKIDFMNGDIFHYLNHLAQGMLKSIGH